MSIQDVSILEALQNVKMVNESESVKRLAARLYRKSQSEKTVRTYVDALTLFFKWLRIGPDDAVKSRFDWSGVLNDFLDYLVLERMVAPATARLYLTAVKKWLEVNGASVDWRSVELPKKWRVEKERLPSKEELREILSGAALRDKVMVLLLLSSGLRLTSLLKLRLKDVKLEYEKPLITVKPEVSKSREGYVTFMSREAKAALLQYLKERELNGEELTPESYLIVKERPKGTPITIQGAVARWHKLLKKANRASKGRKWFEVHLHTLRKYFKSWASLSGVPEALVEAFMGHRKGIEQTYFLPGLEAASNPEVAAKIMAEYSKATPALTVFGEEEKVKELETRLEETKKRLEEEAKKHEEEKTRLEEERRLLEERIKKLEDLVAKMDTLRRKTLLEHIN